VGLNCHRQGSSLVPQVVVKKDATMLRKVSWVVCMTTVPGLVVVVMVWMGETEYAEVEYVARVGVVLRAYQQVSLVRS